VCPLIRCYWRDKIKVAEVGRACSTHGVRNIYNISVIEPEEKALHERARHGEEGNLKMDLKNEWCEKEDWLHLIRLIVLW
jgi:hypothetical protein